MKKMLFALCILTASLSACKKNIDTPVTESGIESNERNPPFIQLTLSLPSPASPGNSQDHYGAQHNSAVTYQFNTISDNAGPDFSGSLTSLMNFANSNYTTSEVEEIEAGIDAFFTPLGRPGQNLYSEGEKYLTGVNTFSASAYTTMINSLVLGSTAKTKLIELVDIMTNDVLYDLSDYDAMQTRLSTWESSVSSLFSGAALDRFLGTASVAKHSIFYWHTYDANIVDTNTMLRGRGFLRWLGWGLVGAADAIGFFVGGGGLTGVITGGAGSYLGFKIFKARGWEP